MACILHQYLVIFYFWINYLSAAELEDIFNLLDCLVRCDFRQWKRDINARRRPAHLEEDEPIYQTVVIRSLSDYWYGQIRLRMKVLTQQQPDAGEFVEEWEAWATIASPLRTASLLHACTESCPLFPEGTGLRHLWTIVPTRDGSDQRLSYEEQKILRQACEFAGRIPASGGRDFVHGPSSRASRDRSSSPARHRRWSMEAKASPSAPD